MQYIQAAMEKARSSREEAKPHPISIVTRADVPSLWDRLRWVAVDSAALVRHGVFAFDNTHPSAIPFDMLRTHVSQKMRQNGWKSIAVTSPTVGCGKTIVAANLAFGLSRQDEGRTLLMDLNFRRPKIAELLALTDATPLEDLLSGQRLAEDAILRCGDKLAVAANGEIPDRPSELLQSPRTVRQLWNLCQALDPQFVVYDLPAMHPHDDAASFLPHVDCVLIVLAAEQTTAQEADRCEFTASQATPVIGVVFNKCRYDVHT